MKTFDDYLAKSTAPKNIQPCDPVSVWVCESAKMEERNKNHEQHWGEYPQSYDWEANSKYYEAERDMNRLINSGGGTVNFGKRCTR